MSRGAWTFPPLRCRIACKLIGASPSAMMCDCILGRRSANARKCAKCPAYIPGLIAQGFDEGVKTMRARVGKSVGTIIFDPDPQEEVSE